MKNIIIIFITIIAYLLVTKNIYKKNKIKYLSLIELIEYNIKLYFINNAGITYIHNNGAKLLDIFIDDSILIKMHRKLNKKYGKAVMTYIIGLKEHYYILDVNLSKKILNKSPEIFESGKIKEDFFNKIMPNNLGISKCRTKSKCPWKKRRIFNEKVLGTNNISPVFLHIINIVKKNILIPPVNIDDFKEISFKIVAKMIYGKNNDNEKILKEFQKLAENDINVVKTNFYKKYIKHLHKSYKTAPKSTLLNLADEYKADDLKIIDDQIPHWFGPFIFIISFLIPNFLCIILNYKDVYNKIMKEISDINFDIYSKKSYLHFCVIEHIRLFNTININIPRTVNKDIILENIKFKKGDQIFMLFSSILRDEKEFKNPDMYIPERWEDRSIENQNIVFGVGPQQCPSIQITPFLYKSIIRHLLSFKYSKVNPKICKKNLYFINPYDISFSI